MFIVSLVSWISSSVGAKYFQLIFQRFGNHSAPTELRQYMQTGIYKHFVPTGLG